MATIASLWATVSALDSPSTTVTWPGAMRSIERCTARARRSAAAGSEARPERSTRTSTSTIGGIRSSGLEEPASTRSAGRTAPSNSAGGRITTWGT